MKSGYKLLIIEDSKTFSNMLKRAFKSISSEIIQAFSFMEAEEYVENEEFDFILLDLILPDGEGEELIEMLPKKLRHKTIVLSGDEDVERRSHVFDLGILDYFSKLNPMPLIVSEIKNLMDSIQTNKEINILVIDDSSFMRRKIKSILTPRQYNIFLAESGEDGLEIIKNESIHLILLDVELNGMNGLEVLEILKKDSKLSHIPVITISGNDSPYIVARLLKQGASDFIKKPFIVEQFLLKCDLHIKNYKILNLLKQKSLELKKSEEIKSKFLANMSHEIRTPLNAIMGFISLLKQKNCDEESKNYLNVIDDSSKTLLSILNDILDISKIEAGKLVIEKIAFNPKKEFDSVIDLFKLKAEEKMINITEKCENLPHLIVSDPVRIKQVMMNLLSNAVKFTPKHKNIFVNIIYKDNRLKVIVKDEGIGLTETQIEKIFNPFVQADDSTTRKYGGTGLGLSISFQIIELLGGELKVTSKENEGSEFSFEIPVEIENSCCPEKEKIHNKNLKGKILVVEDNKANQLFMRVILKKLNLDSEIANNGVEGVEKFKTGNFDLILMDENMPMMSGIEATKEIRKIENNNSHIPIIAVTANAITGDKKRFIEAGFDEYLSKPLDIEKLKQLIAKFL